MLLISNQTVVENILYVIVSSFTEFYLKKNILK